jgi:hypothetical protein
VLNQAVADLSWLLSRGYAAGAALKLVGDRFQLIERQRIAVMRCSCADADLQHRQQASVSADRLAGQRLDLDGFNILTTVEAALAGGLILQARDGCFRDMASMHGSFRRVHETQPALERVGQVLEQLEVGEAMWFLDRPVSNSGRLAEWIRQLAIQRNWPWQVELVQDPDAVLAASPHIVASADCAVLDRCRQWYNLAREVVIRRVPRIQLLVLDGQTPG